DSAELVQVREHASETTHLREEEMETENLTAEVGEIRAGLDELTRKVEMGFEPAEPEGPVARSFGDFVQKVAAGDERATRAYDGAVSGDWHLQDQWVGNLMNINTKRQTIAGTFARSQLPAKGLTVEYALLDSDSTDVDVQAAEGDDLDFGKVSITTASANVKTLG